MAAPNVQKQASKRLEERDDIVLVRIAGYDIPGDRTLYPGLTRIKGVGWIISNAACIILKIPRNKRISELSKEMQFNSPRLRRSPVASTTADGGSVKNWRKYPGTRIQNRWY